MHGLEPIIEALLAHLVLLLWLLDDLVSVWDNRLKWLELLDRATLSLSPDRLCNLLELSFLYVSFLRATVEALLISGLIECRFRFDLTEQEFLSSWKLTVWVQYLAISVPFC